MVRDPAPDQHPDQDEERDGQNGQHAPLDPRQDLVSPGLHAWWRLRADTSAAGGCSGTTRRSSEHHRQLHRERGGHRSRHHLVPSLPGAGCPAAAASPEGRASIRLSNAWPAAATGFGNGELVRPVISSRRTVGTVTTALPACSARSCGPRLALTSAGHLPAPTEAMITGPVTEVLRTCSASRTPATVGRQTTTVQQPPAESRVRLSGIGKPWSMTTKPSPEVASAGQPAGLSLVARR